MWYDKLKVVIALKVKTKNRDLKTVTLHDESEGILCRKVVVVWLSLCTRLIFGRAVTELYRMVN